MPTSAQKEPAAPYCNLQNETYPCSSWNGCAEIEIFRFFLTGMRALQLVLELFIAKVMWKDPIGCNYRGWIGANRLINVRLGVLWGVSRCSIGIYSRKWIARRSDTGGGGYYVPRSVSLTWLRNSSRSTIFSTQEKIVNMFLMLHLFSMKEWRDIRIHLFD